MSEAGERAAWFGDDEAVFAPGQRVELYATIPSSLGGSVESGTRGIVEQVKEDPAGTRFLVVFLEGERATGERAWLTAEDLLPA